MTIVGDVAQTSAGGGVRNWASTLDSLIRGSWRLNELTVTYRTPAAIAQVATAFAHAAGLPVSPLEAVRDVPHAYSTLAVEPASLMDASVQAAFELGRRYLEPDGSGQVAIIADPLLVDPLRELVNSGLELAFGPDEAARMRGLKEPQLVVLDAKASKGLEFDAVVLVEPAAIAAPSTGKSALQAASDLYVSMTRPIGQLEVVHSQPLPAGFNHQTQD
jgi:DNA helicase IV